jgi:hypothetical protein
MREDRSAFDEVLVLLRELEDGTRINECLVDPSYVDAVISKVEPFWHLQNEHLNVYTVKLYDIAQWRIISAVDHHARRIALLALMRRDQDYEKDAELLERLRHAYEQLCFKKLVR